MVTRSRCPPDRTVTFRLDVPVPAVPDLVSVRIELRTLTKSLATQVFSNAPSACATATTAARCVCGGSGTPTPGGGCSAPSPAPTRPLETLDTVGRRARLHGSGSHRRGALPSRLLMIRVKTPDHAGSRDQARTLTKHRPRTFKARGCPGLLRARGRRAIVLRPDREGGPCRAPCKCAGDATSSLPLRTARSEIGPPRSNETGTNWNDIGTTAPPRRRALQRERPALAGLSHIAGAGFEPATFGL